MAKTVTISNKIIEKKFPSRFGSHKSMISEEMTNKLNDLNFVILEDDNGFYVTERNRLDDGGADTYRWTTCEHKSILLKKFFPEAKITCSDDKVIINFPKKEENAS